MATEAEKELDWQAFLYISDEMSDEERRSFESRLAGDQRAREAVACAVEIGQAVALAGAQKDAELVQSVSIQSAATASRWLRLEWMSIGAAACLAMVVLYTATTRPHSLVDADPGQGDSREIASSNLDLERLAQLWGAQRDQAGSEESDQWRSEVEGLAELDSLAAVIPEIDEISAVEAPPWMLAAVAGLSQADGNEMDRDRDPQEN